MQDEALELRYQTGKTNLGAVICALFSLLGIYLIATSSVDPTKLVTGVLFAGVGILGLLECNRRVNDTSVILRIGPDGLLDKRLGPNLIRWEDILAIEERQTWGERPLPYLDLTLADTARVSAGLSSILWRLSGSRGFPITHNGLAGTFHQIYRAARTFADKRGVPFSTASSVLFE
jgi:hypothetical protein